MAARCLRRLGFVRATICRAALGIPLACDTTASPQLHLIPDGYVGPVVVVYGAPNGATPSLADAGEVEVAIGANGALYLAEEAPPAGFYDVQYFYVSSSGIRSKIRYRGDEQSLQVFAAVDGATGAGEEATRWAAYLVGVPAERDDWVEIRERATARAVRPLRSQEQSGFVRTAD